MKGKEIRRLEKLRKLNRKLEALDARVQKLPPGRRVEIDTHSEKLNDRKAILAHLMNNLRNTGKEQRGHLEAEIDGEIERFREEIDKLEGMIIIAEREEV
jgi:vacuolar-type H+-ATPase subunit I/STV1